jgi:phosphohistidine phosphatase
MMNLYLIQHAQAFSKEQYADRPLTEEGFQNAQKTADFIKRLNLPVETVWHSGKTRALQTAKIFHAAVRTSAPLEVREGLSPEDDPEPIADQIESSGKDLLIVGHLPSLARLAGLLLTGSSDLRPVAFQKAGVVCLRQNEDGDWQLAWMITPDLL